MLKDSLCLKSPHQIGTPKLADAHISFKYYMVCGIYEEDGKILVDHILWAETFCGCANVWLSVGGIGMESYIHIFGLRCLFLSYRSKWSSRKKTPQL
jgi:hypothetical protein